MRIQLHRRWTDRLLQLPESGMGYQRVCVRLKDGRILENVVALNAEILEISDDAQRFDAADIVSLEPAGSDT